MQWHEEFRRATGPLTGEAPLIVALATVDGEGLPHVRSVVIRQITGDGVLLFTSDARSGKSKQLAAQNAAEIAAWLPASREQFRLRGRVTAVAADSPLRLQIWRQFSDASRATFFWPAPGEIRTDPDSAFLSAATADTAMPASFEVLTLDPDAVEQLILTSHPHRRTRWLKNQGWSVEEINP